MKKPHSAEYFGEARDYWWNSDFFRLMGKRWGLANIRSVLDVGCGVGHWSRLLDPFLPAGASVKGIDPEPLWIARARQISKKRKFRASYSYEKGSAESLPFSDNTFDFVTCQTLLIHVKNPLRVIREMARVVKPGGMIAVAEPNNIVQAFVRDSVTFNVPLDEILALARLQLLGEKGKEILGEGNNSVADLLPGNFNEAGLRDIRVYLSDKAFPLFPPYGSVEQRALLKQSLDWAERGFWQWGKAGTRKYFIAGGGKEKEFHSSWPLALRSLRRFKAAVGAGTFHCGGGSVMYLISGRKPPSIRQS